LAKLRGPDFSPSLHLPALDLVRAQFQQIANPREVEVLAGVIEERRQQLARLGVLTELEPSHQTELAAMVLDFDDAHRLWTGDRNRFRRLQVLSRRGPGHIRKLAAKVFRIGAALKELDLDSQALDPSIAERVSWTVRQARGLLAQIELVRRGESVDSYVARMARWCDEASRFSPPIADPRKAAAEHLVLYLTGRGLPMQDAQVRVAKLGNAFWQWELTIGRDAYHKADCPSLRMWLLRRRRTQGRTHRKKGR
jgi:hypothetical protein